MKQLSAADLKAWEGHRAEAEKALAEAQKVHGELVSAITDFNAEIAELSALATGWADEAETYQQERSERWQESEAGQAYSAWPEQLRALADQIEELEAPEEPDEPDWLAEDPPSEP